MRLLAILAVLIGAIAIPAALRADEPQTVVVDTEHNFLSGRKTFPPPYRIKPCTSFTVDGTAFEFELPAEFRGRVPDALQVTDLGKKMYIVHWSDNDRRAALSVATMIPYGESLPFSGFKSGETYFLSIGHLAETPEETAWVWFGAVEVE